MINEEMLSSLGFRDFVHKNPLKQDGKTRKIFYGIYLDRSLVILLVEGDGGASSYEIETISLDHEDEMALIKNLFGNIPTVEQLVTVLKLKKLN